MEYAEKERVARQAEAHRILRAWLFGDRDGLSRNELQWALWSMELDGRQREVCMLEAALRQLKR